MTYDLSVIVAVYNEDPRNLLALLQRLWQAITPTGMSYEVIFVNDGSRLKTAKALRQIANEVDYVKLLNLSRNFGQQAAISAGLAESTGQAVVNIDSDLQDPPELIPQMMDLWRQGFDVVYAQRSTRRDKASKRLSAFLFYRILGAMSSVDIPWDTGDFRLMDRKVVNALCALPEKTRFLRGLIPWLGFKQTGIAIDRDAREFGESTYTLKKLLQLAFDGLLSFSVAPLYMVPAAGGVLLATSILGLIVYLIFGHAGANQIDGGILLAVLAILAGLQMISIGLVAVYMSKMLDEVRARPTYIVAERVGIPFVKSQTDFHPPIEVEIPAEAIDSAIYPQASEPVTNI
jgi:dolichol-phosphate mannosyltransferase